MGDSILKKLLILFLVLLFFSCKNLVTDLPVTDYDKYITGTQVFIPKETKAIDVYNTIKYIFRAENTLHIPSNGNWKYLKYITEDVITGDKEYKNETKKVNTINFFETSENSEIHTYSVIINIEGMGMEIIQFKWQRQTTNVWKNDILGGELSFDLP